MKRFLIAAVLMLAAWAGGAWGGIDTFVFDSPQQEKRFITLTEELRCLVCQNQSLAESNAELALDLRREVYEMIRKGKSDTEITDFLVARYGDFVLYRPPVKSTTYLLWFGPLLLFVGAAIVLVVMIRRRAQASHADGLSADEARRLEGLLKDAEEKH